MIVGNSVIEHDALTVTIGNEIFDSPPKEFYLLFKLLSNSNKVFTKLELMAELNGMEYMRKDFMSSVSHEIKTLVAAMKVKVPV